MGGIPDNMRKGWLARHAKIFTREANGIPATGSLEANKKQTQLSGSKTEGVPQGLSSDTQF